MPRTREILGVVGSLVLFGGALYYALRSPRKRRSGVGFADLYRVDERGQARRGEPSEKKQELRVSYAKESKGKVKYPKMSSTGATDSKLGSPLFTSTSKLRAPSWGLPAGLTCPAVAAPLKKVAEMEGLDPYSKEFRARLKSKAFVAKLAEVIPQKCWSCYATGGNYAYADSRGTQLKRLAWWDKTPDDQKVSTLVDAVKHAGNEKCHKDRSDVSGRKDRCEYQPMAQPEFFRLFDSGDFSSPHDVRIWTEVARRLPKTKFWFPTSAWKTCGWSEAEQKEFNDSLRDAAKLSNVTVRPSAHLVDHAAPAISGLHAGSAIVEMPEKAHKEIHRRHAVSMQRTPVTLDGVEHYLCPGDCTYCRHCWLAKDQPVAYRRHGRKPDTKHVPLMAKRARGEALKYKFKPGTRKKGEKVLEFETRELKKRKMMANKYAKANAALRLVAERWAVKPWDVGPGIEQGS